MDGLGWHRSAWYGGVVSDEVGWSGLGCSEMGWVVRIVNLKLCFLRSSFMLAWLPFGPDVPFPVPVTRRTVTRSFPSGLVNCCVFSSFRSRLIATG